MNSASFSVSSIVELIATLEASKTETFTPTVAIAFCDPGFPFEDAIPLFYTHQIKLVGCTTSGEIRDDGILEGSFSFLLMDMDPSAFDIVRFEHENLTAYSSGKRLFNHAKECFDNPGIFLLISGVRVVGDGPVKGIRDMLQNEVPIFGGLAGDNIQHEATYVFTDDGVEDFGIAALIVDQDFVLMEGQTVSGWKPLGRTHYITKAQGNLIYEIDDQPALDLFLSYFGHIEYKPPNASGLQTIPGQFPLKLYREDGSSYLRSLLIYNVEDRALMAAGEMLSGTEFKFCPPPDFDVIDQTIEEFRNFRSDEKGFEALVMISCKGRHNSFGPILNDEVSSIHEIWQVPMVGFLANGEIGMVSEGGKCEFHNVSCSLFGLKEIHRG